MRFTGRAMLTHTRLGLWVAAQTRAGGAGTTPAARSPRGGPATSRARCPRTLHTRSHVYSARGKEARDKTLLRWEGTEPCLFSSLLLSKQKELTGVLFFPSSPALNTFKHPLSATYQSRFARHWQKGVNSR